MVSFENNFLKSNDLEIIGRIGGLASLLITWEALHTIYLIKCITEIKGVVLSLALRAALCIRYLLHRVVRKTSRCEFLETFTLTLKWAF